MQKKFVKATGRNCRLLRVLPFFQIKFLFNSYKEVTGLGKEFSEKLRCKQKQRRMKEKETNMENKNVLKAKFVQANFEFSFGL